MGPHNLWVFPVHHFEEDEEVLKKNVAEPRNVTLAISMHAYLHLIAGGAVNDGTGETAQLLTKNIGPGLREYFSTGICPNCFPGG